MVTHIYAPARKDVGKMDKIMSNHAKAYIFRKGLIFNNNVLAPI